MKIEIDYVKELSASSNQKRLDSLKQKKQQYKAQAYLVKSALSQIDSGEPVNKRILFESDDERELGSGRNSVANNKKKLFDDSDSEEDLARSKDDEDDAFQIKPQFEGKKGEKLLALQSTFRNDERFQLDEKFMESDNDEESENEEKLSNCGEDMSIMSERKRNLKILQDITGIHMDSSTRRGKNRTFRDMNKLRYDPAREDAHQFEIKRDETELGNRSKKKRKKEIDPEPVVLPEVSKDKYFEVAPDLKNRFTNKSERNEFSILKTFGNQNEIESEHEDSPYVALPLNQTAKRLSCFDKNAFRYDSSDEDNKIPNSNQANSNGPSHHENNKSGWQFFFTKEDPRLKEGIEFFRKTETDKEISEWWNVTRGKMLDIIYRKIKLSKHKTPRRKGQHKTPVKKGQHKTRRKR